MPLLPPLTNLNNRNSGTNGLSDGAYERPETALYSSVLLGAGLTRLCFETEGGIDLMRPDTLSKRTFMPTRFRGSLGLKDYVEANEIASTQQRNCQATNVHQS